MGKVFLYTCLFLAILCVWQMKNISQNIRICDKRIPQIEYRQDANSPPIYFDKQPSGRIAWLLLGGYWIYKAVKPDDIFEAAEKGKVNRVRTLLRFNPKLANAISDAHYTPLFLAVVNKRTEVVKLLLFRGADPNSIGGDYRPLGFANLEEAKLLFSYGADVNLRDYNGKSPLHNVGAEDVVQLLIANGASVNARDNEGNTPLHDAARYSFYTKKAEILVREGAEVDAPNNNGITPLHIAVREGVPEIVFLLVENGADVNLKDNNGNISLHWAAIGCGKRYFSGNYQVVVLLISKGADVNAVNNDGNTPLHLAAQSRCHEAAENFIKNGANINAKNKKGETPLHLAAATSYVEDIELVLRLIENGADVNSRNNDGETPLTYALHKNYREVGDIIRKHGGTE